MGRGALGGVRGAVATLRAHGGEHLDCATAWSSSSCQMVMWAYGPIPVSLLLELRVGTRPAVGEARAGSKWAVFS